MWHTRYGVRDTGNNNSIFHNSHPYRMCVCDHSFKERAFIEQLPAEKTNETNFKFFFSLSLFSSSPHTQANSHALHDSVFFFSLSICLSQSVALSCIFGECISNKNNKHIYSNHYCHKHVHIIDLD